MKVKMGIGVIVLTIIGVFLNVGGYTERFGHIRAYDLKSEHAEFSVEVGVAEVSPRGQDGGYAIPASGGSSAGCPVDPHWGACWSYAGNVTVGSVYTFVNQQPGYEGTYTVQCLASEPPGALVQGTSCNPVPPSGCHVGPGTAAWGNGSVESGPCGGYVNQDIPNGGSITVGNSNPGYTGQVSYSCSNGSSAQTGPNCSPQGGGNTGGGNTGSCHVGPGTAAWGNGTIESGACGAYINQDIANGGSVTLGNQNPGYAGQVTYSCSNGSVGQQSPSCSSQGGGNTGGGNTGSCHVGPGTAFWDQGRTEGGNCSGYVNQDIPNGGSITVFNASSGYTGQVSYSCSAGRSTQYSPSCSPQGGGNTGGGNTGSCHVGPGTAFWDQGRTEGGNCSSFVSQDIANGGSITITNKTTGYTGEVSYSCSNGRSAQYSPSCSPQGGNTNPPPVNPPTNPPTTPPGGSGSCHVGPGVARWGQGAFEGGPCGGFVSQDIQNGGRIGVNSTSDQTTPGYVGNVTYECNNGVPKQIVANCSQGGGGGGSYNFPVLSFHGSKRAGYTIDPSTGAYAYMPKMNDVYPTIDIAKGESATLYWWSYNAYICNAGGGWSGDKPASERQWYEQTVAPQATTTYTLRCLGIDGVTPIQSVTVNVHEAGWTPPDPNAGGPTLNLVSDKTTIQYGERPNLTWTTQNGAYMCSPETDIFDYYWQAGAGYPPNGTKQVYPTQTTKYSLTCYNRKLQSTGKKSVTITVLPGRFSPPAIPPSPPDPTVDFTGSPSVLNPGGSGVLTWSSSSDVTKCYANMTGGGAPPGAPRFFRHNWNGEKSTNGSEIVTIYQTANFFIRCQNASGAYTDEKRVTIGVTSDPVPGGVTPPGGGGGGGNPPGPRPTADITACKTDATTWSDATKCAPKGEELVLEPGEEIKLRWSSTNASRCDGVGFSSGGNSSGETNTVTEPNPNTTQTYTVTCDRNPSVGPESASVNVRVNELRIDPKLLSNKNLVKSGTSVTLSWDSGTADPSSCTLAGPGIAPPQPITNQSGNRTVVITANSTYTLTCGGGYPPAKVTVKVIASGFET